MAQDSASWSELAPIVDSLNIPVVGNGDVWCREDMKAMKTVGKVKGVMLARGALYNLSVFRKSGGLLPQERVVQDYINLCCDYRNHVANTKYVVCEMITNRRTPLALKKQYKYEFPKNQGVKEVCGVKSLEQMCKLWDINRGTTASGGSSSSTVDVGNGRKYSDNYFLENNNETPIKKQKL
jgi:tRNA-dihydrouridine synthase|tara:strand:+ start:81 stop:623 length:543 start_codon:yes stop_codon:yes gene_type:complete